MSTTTDIYTITPEDRAFREAIVFIKGILVGYAIGKGVKYSSKRTPSETFQNGMEEGAKISLSVYGQETITKIHVIYNRLRKTRAHTGSAEQDQKALSVDYEERVRRQTDQGIRYIPMSEDALSGFFQLPIDWDNPLESMNVQEELEV